MTDAKAMSRDQLIQHWDSVRKDRDKIVAYEMELRLLLATAAFPTPELGMNTIELGNGWELKGEFKNNYNLNNSSKDGYLTTQALTKMAAIGPSSKVAAERLVSWTANLSLTEYKRLTPIERACLETGTKPALVIKPASPAMTLKPPPGYTP